MSVIVVLVGMLTALAWFLPESDKKEMSQDPQRYDD